MGMLRSTAVRFVWSGSDIQALLGSVRRALGGNVGDWDDDDGDLVGIAGLASAEGVNLATYWKPGMLSPLESIGLAIERDRLDDGSDVLHVFAVIPPGGSPMSKGKQGLIQIASMPGATWLPFEIGGAARLRVDFVDPQ